MRFQQAPKPLLQLVTAILLSPRFTTAFAVPSPAPTAGISINELFARQACAGTPCGYYNQLCCTAGLGCYTDTNSQAQCTPSGAVPQASEAGGYWTILTTTYIETDYVTMTSTYSSYVPGATPAAGPVCDTTAQESPCGSFCCASDQYCYAPNQCAPANPGSSSGSAAGAPIRPTTSGTLIITATVTSTSTVPFIAPVPTGANVTVSESNSGGGGGLSGGAIAGIVIGVLAALLILALLIFYCCVRGIWTAIFGGRRRRRTEVEEYERHSHHHSGGGGRTWYGAPRASGSRVEKKEHHTGRNLLGIGAGLAALWAILGLKRRRENRHNEKYSDYSYSSYGYTDTSASSASSDPRTRQSRRSMSRR